MMQELSDVFVEEWPKLMGEIDASLAAWRPSELRRAAHTLKSSAAVFVATPTVDAALRLERAAEAQNRADAEEARKTLLAEGERLVARMRSGD
jgi:two-component system, sensor histidine kinase and response regulator